MPLASKTRKTTPSNRLVYDPWNSASTGHQRAQNPYSSSSSWRQVRTDKLSRQFQRGESSASNTGVNTEQSANNIHGAQPLPAGEWEWTSASEANRNELGCRDIRSYMNVRKRRQESPEVDKDGGAKRVRVGPRVEESPCAKGDGADNDKPSSDTKQRLFAGTTVYVNGSPMPLISDHKLKHLLVSHGANLSLSLARNSVTHVIVGRTSSSTAAGKGAGGGLAAEKLHKEIERRGRQVKVVYAEWVLESIKASKRLSEANFALDIGPHGQRSVLGMFKR
ncbi:hypothetical protein PHISCL_08389 [Aspergillus sclerotialis]|uniref:BRCT domain-containing protein n=1 Tax=Aspergillus sclerotialis TaxID=2070753 RepID=A0A3A2Z9I8_9EURO|nr:hypothetical protein PHISCL_08389 [Aspergillus sclerotialis]